MESNSKFRRSQNSDIDSCHNTAQRANPRKNQYQQSSLSSLAKHIQNIRDQKISLPPISSPRHNKNQFKKIQQQLARIKQNLKRQINSKPSQKAYDSYNTPLMLPVQYPYQHPYQQPIAQQNQMPMSMPMPMPIPIPIPFPMGGYSYQYPHPEQTKKRKKKHKKKKKSLEIEPQQQQKKQPPKKTVKKNLLRRFRICGYAIYFSIFLKQYSKKFTQNRRDWFNDRYNGKNSKIIYKGSEKVLKQLYKIDLYDIIKQAQKNSRQKQGQQYVQSQEIMLSSPNPQTKKFILATKSLLNKISDLLDTQQFMEQYHEVFTAGTLNQSFMITNLYLPQELHYIHIHPTKGYLQITTHQQIQLLLIRVVIKMIIYNYLFGLKKSETWQKKNQKVYGLDNEQLTNLLEMGRYIGLFLYIVAKQMHFAGLKNIKKPSNFIEYSRRFGIRAAKYLQDNGPQENKKNINFQLIKNLQGIENIEEKLKKNTALREFKEAVKVIFIDMLTNLHQKLKKQQQQVYKYIKQLTLNESYIILRAKNRKYYEKSSKNLRQPDSRAHAIKKSYNYLLNNKYSDTNSKSYDPSSESKRLKVSDILRESQQVLLEQPEQQSEKQNILKQSNPQSSIYNKNPGYSAMKSSRNVIQSKNDLFGSQASIMSNKLKTRYGPERTQNLKYKLKKIIADRQ